MVPARSSDLSPLESSRATVVPHLTNSTFALAPAPNVTLSSAVPPEGKQCRHPSPRGNIIIDVKAHVLSINDVSNVASSPRRIYNLSSLLWSGRLISVLSLHWRILYYHKPRNLTGQAFFFLRPCHQPSLLYRWRYRSQPTAIQIVGVTGIAPAPTTPNLHRPDFLSSSGIPTKRLHQVNVPVVPDAWFPDWLIFNHSDHINHSTFPGSTMSLLTPFLTRPIVTHGMVPPGSMLSTQGSSHPTPIHWHGTTTLWPSRGRTLPPTFFSPSSQDHQGGSLFLY